MDLRSKARTLDGPVSDPKELPKWNYDWSSTGQAPGEDSEVILYPQAIFKEPIRRGNHILVMCDAYTPQGEPIPNNKRAKAAEIFSHPDVACEETWFGIEQEHTLLQSDVNWPVGWPLGGFPGPQGPYYCGIGADKAFGRDIVDSHYKACLYAGINISGINGEVMPGQWEFQVGPSFGISAGDEIWVARYILEVSTDVNIEEVARRIEGYSGDDLTNVCRDASLNGMRHKITGKTRDEIKNMSKEDISNDSIAMCDFEEAIRKVQPSVSTADIERHEKWFNEFGLT